MSTFPFCSAELSLTWTHTLFPFGLKAFAHAEPCSLYRGGLILQMNCLALDYFALDEQAACWPPSNVGVEDIPVCNVKWQWEAPPLSCALMQVYCPFPPARCQFKELAGELDCFCGRQPGLLHHFPAAQAGTEEATLSLEEDWEGGGQLNEEELLTWSRQWLSEYAAKHSQDLSSEVAMKQVDQDCEWMNQNAETHDLQDVEMPGSVEAVMSEAKETRIPEKSNTAVQQSLEVHNLSLPPTVLPVQSMEGMSQIGHSAAMNADIPVVPLCAPEGKTWTSETELLMPPAEAPLSMLWQSETTKAKAAPRSLDLKQLGVDSLQSIWTLENLSKSSSQMLHENISVSCPSEFVVDGCLKLLVRDFDQCDRDPNIVWCCIVAQDNAQMQPRFECSREVLEAGFDTYFFHDSVRFNDLDPLVDSSCGLQ